MPRASNESVYSTFAYVRVYAHPAFVQAARDLAIRYRMETPTQAIGATVTKVSQKAMLQALGVKDASELPAANDMEKMVRSLFEERDLSKMPMAPQPAQATPALLKTQLFSYQLQSLAWMLERETERHVSIDTPDSLWTKTSKGWYTHSATHATVKTHPKDPCRGGILGDDVC
eukprot:TRINITY_DN3010_c0_g1_i1.p1 TRINITY_DN3010_c0_g1~~TRINITY_DN3010_c0_g1_i1.p1  ORF type:complete len:173 (+),score=44.91 TRINITY_DN3010_c0_g1_i1:350-868(+)